MASINPLDCDLIPVTVNYINGMYLVGMNTSWMVLVDGGDSWMLMEVYTRRLIPVHSINTALLWHRGPGYSESYTSEHDTKFDLLKVVICQVPTQHADYADFKLIALFDKGLAYLYAGALFSWRQLSLQWIIVKAYTHFCDAIEHNGIIYAIDKEDGTTYCWDDTCKLFPPDVNDDTMTLFELFVMIGISLFEQNLSRTMAMYWRRRESAIFGMS